MRFDFDRPLKLEFHGSKITSDAGLLAYNPGNFLRTLALSQAVEILRRIGELPPAPLPP